MATLFDQEPRYKRVSGKRPEEVFEKVEYLQNNYDVTFDQALALVSEARLQTLAEYQMNDLDVKDEQLAGFGELVQSIAISISEAVEKME